MSTLHSKRFSAKPSTANPYKKIFSDNLIIVRTQYTLSLREKVKQI